MEDTNKTLRSCYPKCLKEVKKLAECGPAINVLNSFEQTGILVKNGKVCYSHKVQKYSQSNYKTVGRTLAHFNQSTRECVDWETDQAFGSNRK